MNPLTRNILFVGVILILAMLGAGIVTWVMPLESKISDLKRQIDTKIVERREALRAMQLIEASSSALKSRMAEMGEFDLRKEDQPANALDGRANAALIKLSSILEEASLSVLAISPVPKSMEDIALATGTPPVASVINTNYTVHVQGNYTYMLQALAKFDTLPPTLEVEGYRLKYIEKDGLAARCDLELDLAFKFLTPPSTGAINPSDQSGFDELFQDIRDKAGERQGWLPDDPAAGFVAWLIPPAMAAEQPRAEASRVRRYRPTAEVVVVRKAPARKAVALATAGERLRPVRVHSVPERLVPVQAGPVVALAPILARASVRAGWGLPLGALPGAATATDSASGSTAASASALPGVPGRGLPGAKGKTLPGGLAAAPSGSRKKGGLVIGKAEPFWPIIEASDDVDLINVPSASAPMGFVTRPAAPILPPSLRVNGQAFATPTPSPTPLLVVATPKPLPTIRPVNTIVVRGIVMVGNQSRAIVVMDGMTRRVTEGDYVAAGIKVRTIDRSGVIFDGPGGAVRRELSRTWNPTSSGSDTQGGLQMPGGRSGALPGTGAAPGAGPGLAPGVALPQGGQLPSMPLGLPNPAQLPPGAVRQPPPLPAPQNPGG
ncbi:MAG: hypothetical protein VKP57_06420 [Candidatus Sericytochromatia bacterium]|nr:hypothetical protein [Candidatus Sericytochromatia bacterium]